VATTVVIEMASDIGVREELGKNALHQFGGEIADTARIALSSSSEINSVGSLISDDRMLRGCRSD
jgi:hypothetical protein